MSLGFTSYTVENDEKLSRALERAASTVSDLRIPLSQIAKDFRKSRQAIFTLKGPGQYPDLNEKYKKRKIKILGSAYPILKLTGRLDRSVTNASDPENVSRIGKQSAELGTTTPYAIYHQSDAPRTKIPLRKFLFVGPESVKFANSEVSGFPERALNTLNSFVLRTLGASIEEATGVKPIIKKGTTKP
jgi:phage gpG-like protein